MSNGWSKELVAVLLVTTLAIAALALQSSAQSNGLGGITQAVDNASTIPMKEWPSLGGDWNNGRYSGLTQISTKTVKNLSGVWLRELNAPTRATPIVKNGVMFIPDASRIYALNPTTGDIIWSYSPEGATPSRSGLAVGQGKVFSGLSDARVIALDEKTGTLIWTRFIGDEPKRPGQGISGGLIYAKGLVFSGLGNGDSGARGRMVALEADSGREAWSFYSIPEGDAPGSETWPQTNIRKIGGGGVWMHAAVDTDLGLLYYGVGNALPQWGGELRGGDNLFAVTVLALDIRNGKLRWYRQLVHHDIWDMDLATPLVLYDATVNGQTRKAIAALRTDGYLFMFDRETGEPIIPVEERPVKQDVRQKTAATQPFPVGGERVGPVCMDPSVLPSGFVPGCWFDPVYYDQPNVVLPGITTRSAPISYDPQTGYFYVMGSVSPWWFRRVENPYYFFWSKIPTAKEYGVFAAIDSRTDKIVWQKRSPWGMCYGSGALTTAGGLLFHMEADGNFQAQDAKTGDLLWQFQTGFVAPAGSNLGMGAPAITYEMNGEQYVAVPIGQGLWAFKLGGQLGARPPATPPPSEWPFSGLVERLPSDGTAEIALAALLESRGEHFQDEYAIRPVRTRVTIGTTVKWVNDGAETHTIGARDGSWTTGPIGPGQSASVKFDKPGEYVYICKDHPWSIAQLIVE